MIPDPDLVIDWVLLFLLDPMSFLYAKYGKAVIAGEVIVLGATYYIYKNLTEDAAYRKRMEVGTQ